MKKKAFTLIELLAIITILGVMLLISLPALVGTTKKNEERQYNDFLNNLYIASENYVLANKIPELEVTNGTVFLSINDLIKNGYFKKDTQNPKTKNIVDNNTIRIVKKEDKTLSYEYLDGNYTINGYNKTGLVLQYDGYMMPENNIVKDLSSQKNDCTLTNFKDLKLAWDASGIQYDGLDDTCKIKNKLDHAKFTISMVVKPVNTNKRHVVFVTWPGYTFELNADNTIAFGIYQNPNKQYLTGNKFEYDKPNYITLTFDGVVSKMYVSGQKVVETNNSPIIYSGSETVISSTSYDVFKGKINNTLFYDRALSDEEINNNYKIDQVRFGVE
ncbi:MAG: LamG-like jellyroll fold domain-containing protein [Bacilli bacterium]